MSTTSDRPGKPPTTSRSRARRARRTNRRSLSATASPPDGSLTAAARAAAVAAVGTEDRAIAAWTALGGDDGWTGWTSCEPALTRLDCTLAGRAELLAVSEPLQRRWHRSALLAFADNERVLGSARQISAAFTTADVEAVAIKGAANVGAHASPEHRRIGDVDLVVPRPQLMRAVRSLRDLGLSGCDVVTPVFLAGRHAVELRAGDGTVVDLHWRFAPTQPMTGRSRQHPGPGIFQRGVAPPVIVDLGGMRIPCVEDSLVITALHGCRRESGHLGHLAADAHVLMQGNPALDWDVVDRTARELGHRTRVSSWLAGVVDDFGTTVPAGSLPARRPTVPERIATLGERSSAITPDDDPAAPRFLIGWAAATTAWAPWRAPEFLIGQLGAAWGLSKRRAVVAHAAGRAFERARRLVRRPRAHQR